MKTLQLKLVQYSKYLSGRSLAREILDKVNLSDFDAICFDLSGVEALTQSFVSETFFVLSERGFNLEATFFVNTIDPSYNEKIERERQRFIALKAS